MKNDKKAEKAMVFGVFDGLHEGHKYFLSESAKRSEKLIVVVTLPELVRALKNRFPKNSLENRIQEIRSFDPNIAIVPGDKKLGEWQVLKDHRPEIVFLGHDQHGIAKELEKLKIPFEFIDFYK